MFAFVNGPLVWIAFAVFILGSIWQINSLLAAARQTDKVFYNHANSGAAFASVLAWMLPFGSRSWREQPGITALTYAFHLPLVLVPLFALGHTVTLEYNLGIKWPSFSDGTTDALTLVFLAAAVALLVRRFVVPAVKIVTTCNDYVVWVVTVLPFVTGYLLAHKMVADPDVMLLLHALSGCLMLILVPFTKLAHAFLFFLTRAFIGSEFARRGTKTW